MKVKTIRSSWWERYGYRLDCQPYLQGALETKIILEGLSVRKDMLQSLTKGHNGGIYHAGREARHWVDSPEFGVPFLSSSAILNSNLSNLPFISKRQLAENPLFLIQKGYTLITRSGTIGRMAYVRREMDGLACSEHVLRVVSSGDRIPSGYLHAFLSSKFGIPLVVSGTYGSIIQSIEPEHIAGIPVPRFGPRLERKVHDLVEEAAELRTKASEKRAESGRVFAELCGLTTPRPILEYRRPFYGSAFASIFMDRMDATYFTPPCEEARAAFDAAGKKHGEECVGKVAEVFIPPIFKRQYSNDPAYGVPYFTGADVLCVRPELKQYLRRSVAITNRLLLEYGMIVLHEADQRYGLIGNAVMVGRTLDASACTNNMVRIKPNDLNDTGYVFAVLSSEYGVRLIKREAAGSSIPHLEEGRIKRLRIPWPGPGIRKKIAAIAHEARELADKANEKEIEAEDQVNRSIEGAV